MRYIQKYSIFESNRLDIKSDIEYILLDISDDDYWDVEVYSHNESFIILIETTFDYDFIPLPEDSKESITRLIEYMRTKGFINYKIKKNTDIVVLGGDDISESDEVSLDEIDNLEFTTGNMLLIKFEN
jgi:hypothetical protein